MGLEYRYMPPTQRLLAELDAGTVGDVKMVAIREHRFPFLPKVDNWNRFTRNTGGTLVEKTCHFFDLMMQITGAKPVRVFATGGQSVNHLDETYDGEVPDILDNAYVVVDFDDGSRGLLDLCMFAEASVNEQEIVVTGDVGKMEALVTESKLRIGRRADGQHVVDTHEIHHEGIKHVGLHHGSSYLEHVDFAAAIRSGVSTGRHADGRAAVGGDRLRRASFDRHRIAGDDGRAPRARRDSIGEPPRTPPSQDSRSCSAVTG